MFGELPRNRLLLGVIPRGQARRDFSHSGLKTAGRALWGLDVVGHRRFPGQSGELSTVSLGEQTCCSRVDKERYLDAAHPLVTWAHHGLLGS